jgi:sodium transport system permease protein
MKKECARIFGDRRLFFTAVVLPGLLMFTMYSLMGSLFSSVFDVEDTYVYQVHVVNLPDSIENIFYEYEREIEIFHAYADEIQKIKLKITDSEADLLVIFPKNFDELTINERPDVAPEIEIWANFARAASSDAHSIVTRLLNEYHHSLTHRFTINAHNLATDADMFAMLLGMIVPLLFTIFIFTGCQSLAPESIAGEKERGTLGAILVTPANRRAIALGKILGIAIFALLSAMGSILGATLAMPRLVGMDGGILDFYAPIDFVLLLLVTASTTLIFVSFLSVLSAYAKSVKEATSYAMPLLLVVFVAGLAGMIPGDIANQTVFYVIPVVNSVLSISSIFSFNANGLNILITLVANIIPTLICTFILAKIFDSEKLISGT